MTEVDAIEAPVPVWKRVLLFLKKLLQTRDIPAKYKPWLFGLAVVLFVGITVLAFRSLPKHATFHWWPLPILLLVMCPLTFLANAGEYRVMGSINGHRIRWLPAVRLVIFASAANLLPLPGGTVIRSEALHRLGSKYRHAIAANAAAWLVWMAVACVAIGALFVGAPRERVASAPLICGGVAVLIGVLVMLRRISGRNALRCWVDLIVVETATVAVSGVRIYLAFRLIGLPASFAQSVALSGSQIIASAVGIFPAGLGLREALAGGIGDAVHLGVYATIAATATDRLISQLGLALVGGPLILLKRRDRRAAGPVPAPDVVETDPSSTTVQPPSDVAPSERVD